MEKLYIVVRADLEPGAQLAQSNHAMSQFARIYRALHDQWTDAAQNLVVLEVPSEVALGELARRAAELHIPKAEFHEPDLNHELTACAFSGAIGKHVAQLPLAGRRARCEHCKRAVVPLYLCQACA